MSEFKSVAAARLLAALFLFCQCSSTEPGTSTEGGGGEGAEAGMSGGEGAEAGMSGGEGAEAGMSGGEGGASSFGGDSGGNPPDGASGHSEGADANGGSGGTNEAGRSGSGNGGSTKGGVGGEDGPGAGRGGSGGEAPRGQFMLGADISSLPEFLDAGTTFVDTDGAEKSLLSVLGNHGFNYVRLRTFVDPNALYGYANPSGREEHKKPEPYCDTEHTMEVAQQAKQAGMGFLLDLHYSDNWADPGKQVIPSAWRNVTSVAELASHVKSYTQAVVGELVANGARPDMVQLGNEITPGLLIHIPAMNPNPDEWGNMTKLTNPYNGSASNFNNVATLLKAGVDGVKAVDPTIKIMLHLENTTSYPAVRDWVNAVRSRGVQLDVLGLSCYTSWQGQPTVWKDTFERLAQVLDGVSFVIAEYNPEATAANEIMADLPDGRGLGTFFWEPTRSGSWGPSLFEVQGDTLVAKAEAFAEFDALRANFELDSRL